MALVSRFRAMPVGDRRSSPALFHNRRRWQGAASLALVSRFRAMPVGDRRSSPALFHNPWRWQGAASLALVSRFRAMPVGDRRSSRALSQSLTLAGGGVIGAGFALPRDAGRRPALQALSQSLTLAGGGVIGAGFALPRDAGRRPALQLSQSAVRGFTSPRTQKAQRQPERRANCGPSTSRWPGHWLQIAPRRNSPSGSGRFHCAARSS